MQRNPSAVAVSTLPGSPGDHKPSVKHIPELDGLRGIAILLVLIYHFGSSMDAPSRILYYVQQLFLFGWTGVDLFFVLSGFLISGILLDARGQDGYFRRFYTRRTLRIFPLYYLYVVILAIVAIAGATLPKTSWASVSLGELPWYAVYLQNIRQAFGHEIFLGDHLWSLAIEEQFYLLWPLCVYYLSHLKLKWICSVMFMISLFGRLVFWHFGLASGWPLLLYKLTPFRLEAIALGSMVALICHESRTAASLKRLGVSALVFGGGAFVLLYYFTRNDASRSAPMKTVGYTAIDLFYAGLLALAWITAGQKAPIARVLRFQPLTSIGKYSYGMYMWHMAILGLLPWWMVMRGGTPLERSIIQVIFGSAITYGVALISWYSFEKWFLALKERLAPAR